ncbi:NUDIX domain-containing protein [Patescibacteria group bacterium]|nr:NUDIX domain-containing protein [Patescibacteria group bacterium]
MRFEFSAGGIIYKKEGNQISVLLCQHAQHHGWVFPKGLIGDNIEGESKEATAIREVKEETGAQAKIIRPLPPITYWYVWEKEKIKKTVYYFLMEYTGGDTTKHDTEMEDVEWLPANEVEKRLTYKADKKVWQQAIMLVNPKRFDF